MLSSKPVFPEPILRKYKNVIVDYVVEGGVTLRAAGGVRFKKFMRLAAFVSRSSCGWRRSFQEVRCLTNERIRVAVYSNDPTANRQAIPHLGAIASGISVQPGCCHLPDAGRLVEPQLEGLLRYHRALGQRRFYDQQEHSPNDP